MRWTRTKLRDIANENGVISRNNISVKIWPNGDILRNDVRLDLAKKMSVTETVKALKLEKK